VGEDLHFHARRHFGQLVVESAAIQDKEAVFGETVVHYILNKVPLIKGNNGCRNLFSSS
jgi:hypothetical protein